MYEKKIFKEFFAKSDFHIIPHREQKANIKFANKRCTKL